MRVVFSLLKSNIFPREHMNAPRDPGTGLLYAMSVLKY